MSRRNSYLILASCVASAVLLLTASFLPAAEPVREKKIDIEQPTEKVVKTSTEANPKVEPGKVKWHKSFADASEAAKKSGKPVFLFQMMGKLDDQFC